MNKHEQELESFERLLEATHHDPVIKKKILSILKMDSYSRHIVLSNWLELLHRRNAPEKLIKMLSYLFDDSIAEMVYEFINRPKKKNDFDG